MGTVGGYEIGDPIHRGRQSTVHRGSRISDGTLVVVKLLDTDYPDIEEVERLRREHRLLGLVHSPYVVRPLELVEFGRGIALALEDIGGEALNSPGLAGRLDLSAFLELAVQAARGLAAIHDAGVVHKDVSPGNVVWNAQTDRAQVIDLNIAQRESARAGSGSSAGVLEGTLAYMSPEQTGRMNRSVDARSDLYSLGATLYEALTGRPPFTSEQPLELVHAHIARTPRPPHHLDDAIPVIVSDILLRLLAKRAEDRYQSARGLEHDLARCRTDLEEGGAVARFELAEADLDSRFGLSQELYGRRAELAELADAFEEVRRAPKTVVVLVEGEAGIGKSTLVRELYRPVVDAGGWFVSGQAPEGGSSRPYAAVAGALDELTHQLLASSDQALEEWRARVLPALGPNAGVVTGLVPSLAQVLGEQAAPAQLSAAADQARFRITLGRFVRALATAESPLVMFLDDLHQADRGTLDLLDLLVGDPRVGHLLIVGACRPLPEGVEHPLVGLADRLADLGGRVRSLRPVPLDVDQVARLVADSLHRTPEQARELAALCLRKTDGNPFFLAQFLCSLHEEGTLRFEPDDGWSWDLDRIAGLDITDNVVDLMSARMDQLSAAARDALRVAACAGQDFDASVVSLLGGEEPQACLAALQEAAGEGLVTPAGGAFQFARRTAGDPTGRLPRRYRFVHDRIRQAAAALSSEEQRQLLHLSLARTLRAQFPEEPTADQLFELVSHYTQVGSRLDDPDERLAVARLYLAAAQRARQALVARTALEHLERGAALLPTSAWADHYGLTYTLHLEATHCAQLEQDEPGMQRWGQPILDRGRSAVDRAPVCTAWVAFFHVRRQPSQALEWFVRGAKLLKARFPLRPGIHHILARFLGLQATLAISHKLDGSEMEPMTDPRSLALLDLTQAAGPVAYFASPNLVPLIAFTITRATARKGVCDVSAWGIIGYAMVLVGAFGWWSAGFRFADAALSLQRRFGGVAGRANAEYLYYAMIHHWRSPLREVIAPMEEAGRAALDHGDLDGAIFCRQVVGIGATFSGLPLPEASRALDENERLMGRYKQSWFFECNAMRKHSLRALDGGDEVPLSYAEVPFDPDVYVAEAMAEGDWTSVAMYRVHEALVCFILGDRERALAACQAIGGHMDAVLATSYVPLHALFFALGLCDAARNQPRRAARLVRKALRKARGLRTAAMRAPMNYRAMWLLVQAEALRARGRGYEAIPTYEEARRLAGEHGFAWLAALAGELMSEVLREGGSTDLADVALWDACYAWRRWGALAKVARLEQEHPELLKRTELARAAATVTSTSVRTTTGSRAGDRLDLETILKTSQTLSEQLVLSELLDRMMAAVLENAAAQRGMLLSRRDGGWQADVEHDLQGVVSARPGAAGFAREVVRYVARTGEVIVLGDAAASADFASDPYLRRERPRSLLCLALEHRGELTGILYLEHHDSTDAFTEDRVEVLRMLCGQIAISIENARLFTEQERVNRAYERFVPREFLGLLGKRSIVDVELGDQVEREMTVLFSDVQGFTSLSEAMSPAENFAFINEFLSMMEPVFARFGGFIDKYIGDAIMALFPTGADDAVGAAVGMVQELALLNEGRAARGLPAVRIGIGLNSGLLMLGTVGGRDRMDGTVISDAVNLASRVEGLTRVFGTTILISERTYGYLREPDAFEFRSIGQVKVKGKATPVSVMEVLDGDPLQSRELKRETLADFDEAMAAWTRGDLDRAAALFGSVLRWNPDDAVATHYLARCRKPGQST